jgi:mono/diheme cytochrome c family protein
MRLRVVLLLLVGVLFAAAGCGGGEETSPLPETVEGTVEGGETTTEAETETGETETEAEDGGEGNAEAGEEVFVSAGCGGCHVLEAAGSSGSVGPNLDESQPDHELVVDRVTNGMGAMPSFEGQLSEQQIQDVAAYVVESTS